MPHIAVDGAARKSRIVGRRFAYALLFLCLCVIAGLVIWPAIGERILSTNFLPASYSYAGRTAVLWAHAIAESLIAVAYVAISVTLIYLVHRSQRGIPFDHVVLAFGFFLIASACTHFFSVLTMWIPAYVLSGSVVMIAAMASVSAAILLPFAVPRILTLVSAAQASQLTHERLRLAMKSGKTVGWDWDIASGKNLMFGDLQTMFAIPATSHSGTIEEFRKYIYSDDRERLSKIVKDAQDSQSSYVAEFRIVRNDQAVHWVSATGEFLYESDGQPYRMLGMALDVTDRKNAEDSVRRKDIELAEAQRIAGLGSWQWNAATDTVLWSEELYALSGRDPRLPAVSYKDHPTLYTPESWERLRACVEHAMRTGTPYEVDLEMIRTDGTTRWLTARGEAQRDTSGQVIGLRGTVLDITERKRTQDSLTLFRKLIDGSNDAIEVIDPVTLRFLDVNEKGRHDLGYSRQEFLSLGVRDLDPSMDDAAVVRLNLQLSKSESVIFESEHRRKDGSTIPVEVNLRRIQLERPYAVAIVRDISERKRTQQALRESEELLRLAVQAGRMFAYSWDLQTDAFVRSGESAEILGIDNSVPLTKQEFLARIHPEDREKLESAISALTPANPRLQMSYRMTRPDQKVIWLERNSCAHFDQDGRMLRIVGMIADITKRKLAEEALLTVTRRLIEAQEMERARVARELHDDLGQRLALLSVYVQRTRMVSPGSSDELRRCLGEVKELVDKISADVQALSHQLHSSSLDHLGIAPAMRGFCLELASQYGVEIDFQYYDVPEQLQSDVSLCLFRVLQEGLRNAVKHSGVRRFEVELRGQSDVIELTLRDKGVGFDPEIASRGTGLGLTSMRERLKLVHGEFSIESAPRRGTTIHARVPLGGLADQLPVAG